MTVAIRPEADQDRAAIWHVNQQAFGVDAEANLVDALRDGGFAEVSLVAELDGEIVGHILFSRLSIVTKVGTVDALSLAPMAVLPSHCRSRSQSQGSGGEEVEDGVAHQAMFRASRLLHGYSIPHLPGLSGAD